MLTEAACSSKGRYLVAQEFYSDAAIKIWQHECVQRHKNQPKTTEYDAYVRWQRQANEIAVFTLYAYADFAIPKQFDCIFHVDNPSKHLLVSFRLTQSILEAWLPLTHINHGHKHLSVFMFGHAVPAIFQVLHEAEGKSSTVSNAQAMLGFCQAADLPAIMAEAKRVAQLKAQFGTSWWEHNTE